MTIYRYQPVLGSVLDRPFSLVNSLGHFGLAAPFDKAFAGTAGTQDTADTPSVSWIPRVDVYEEPDRFVVVADVPGVETKDIHITAEKNVLTIRGERQAQKRESNKGLERVERATGHFLRRFTLPEGANTDAITARQTNGVLEVVIPKQARLQPRKIEVAAA